jgi:hypothetical protein
VSQVQLAGVGIDLTHHKLDLRHSALYWLGPNKLLLWAIAWSLNPGREMVVGPVLVNDLAAIIIPQSMVYRAEKFSDLDQ